MAGRAEILKWKWGEQWQDSRAADGHRFLRCGTPAQAEGNEADQQADGQTPSGISQESTSPEL